MFRNILVFAIPSVVGGVRKADKPVVPAFHHVAERLSSFIQGSSRANAMPEFARAVEFLQSADGSDVSGSNLTDALDEVISLIDETIMDDIYKHHKDTQALIDSLFNDAVNSTQSANEKHGNAQQAFSTQSDCTRDEKAALTEFETQQELTTESLTRHNDAKGEAETAAAIHGTLGSITFSCDASLDINCTDTTEDFDEDTESALTNFNLTIQGQIETFNGRNVTWGLAIANLSAQRGIEDQAWEDFTEKVEWCDANKTDLDLKVCQWTSAEKDAEAKVTAFEQIVSDVHATGKLHSELDRKAEYDTAKQVICLLFRLKTDDSTTGCGPFTYGEDFTDFVPLDLKTATHLSWRLTGEFIDNMLDRTWTNIGTQTSPPSSTGYEQNDVEKARGELDKSCTNA